MKQLIKERRWHTSTLSKLQENDIVMFPKRPTNNFSPGLTLARVVEVVYSKDKEPREVILEYYGGGKSKTVLEDELAPKGMRKTTRDTNEVIVLGMVTDELNQELKAVHDLVEETNYNTYTVASEVRYEAQLEERCGACINSINLPSQLCQLCLLLNNQESIPLTISLENNQLLDQVKCSLPLQNLASFIENLETTLKSNEGQIFTFSQIIQTLELTLEKAGGIFTEAESASEIRGLVNLIVSDSRENLLKIPLTVINHSDSAEVHRKPMRLRNSMLKPRLEYEAPNVSFVTNKTLWSPVGPPLNAPGEAAHCN